MLPWPADRTNRSRFSHRGLVGLWEGVAEEHGADLGAAQRQAQVAGGAGVDGVDRQAAGLVGGFSSTAV
jgi:hypothetical protein